VAAILRELYRAEPQQFRFGVQLGVCYRALGQVVALRELVEQLVRCIGSD